MLRDPGINSQTVVANPSLLVSPTQKDGRFMTDNVIGTTNQSLQILNSNNAMNPWQSTN